MTRPVIGLARHRGTEAALPGASLGTHLLFSTLEWSLRDKCSLRLLPARYYGSGARDAVAMAEDLLSEVDALVISLPPHPVDLEALFLVRETLGRRVPVVYLPLGEFPRGAWFYRHLYRHLGQTDLMAFSSSADLAVYDALVRSSPARVRVVPFGVDPRPYGRAIAARDATRRRLGVDDDTVVLVVHGRLEPQKNVHAATAVFGQVVRSLHTCVLWLVGPLQGGPAGPYRDALLDALGGHGSDRVRWWGAVPHERIPAILAAADISLNLTLNPDENFGFSTVEAMAAGLPVIATDWGGLRDTVADGVTGHHVPTVVTGAGAMADHAVAARRAVELAHDAAGRRRMGAAGIARVDTMYTAERWANRLLAEIRTLLRPPGPARPHRWTPLGRTLVERYSAALPGPRGGSFPISLPPRPRRVDEDMSMAILTPYATPGDR